MLLILTVKVIIAIHNQSNVIVSQMAILASLEIAVKSESATLASADYQMVSENNAFQTPAADLESAIRYLKSVVLSQTGQAAREILSVAINLVWLEDVVQSLRMAEVVRVIPIV